MTGENKQTNKMNQTVISRVSGSSPTQTSPEYLTGGKGMWDGKVSEDIVAENIQNFI